MTIPQLDDFVLELVPHCASVPPDGWIGDHLNRPLTDVGHQQARSLVAALGTDVAAIYSSPALRCRQTVKPLADAAGLPVTELAELIDTRQFAEPREWTELIFLPLAQPVGGAWTAGQGFRALTTMAGEHPGGRVVAASHGDLIPAFVAMLCAWRDVPLPAIVKRGGWHTIRFAAGSLTIATNSPRRLGQQPGQGRDDQAAEGRQVVAAFLHGHDRAERGDQFPGGTRIPSQTSPAGSCRSQSECQTTGRPVRSAVIGAIRHGK